MKRLSLLFILAIFLASCEKSDLTSSNQPNSLKKAGGQDPVGEIECNSILAYYCQTSNLQLWDMYHTDRAYMTYENKKIQVSNTIVVDGTVLTTEPTYVTGLDGKRYAFDGKNWVEH